MCLLAIVVGVWVIGCCVVTFSDRASVHVAFYLFCSLFSISFPSRSPSHSFDSTSTFTSANAALSKRTSRIPFFSIFSFSFFVISSSSRRSPSFRCACLSPLLPLCCISACVVAVSRAHLDALAIHLAHVPASCDAPSSAFLHLLCVSE